MKLGITARGLLRRLTFDVFGLGRPNVSFLFMDDSFCHDKTRISAMVGLLVPLSDYENLRAGFYRILQPFIQPKPGHIARPPEVHGVDLPGETDEEKLRVVSELVDLVVHSRMKIFRVGYYITEVLEQKFTDDPRLQGMCVSSLKFMINEDLKRQLIIPVMDGIDSVIAKRFSSQSQMTDVMRAATGDKLLSISHSGHLLGETFYADSKFAVFTQIVDIVAYLRKVTDMRDDGYTLPPFKQQLLKSAHRLGPRIAREHIIAIRFNGVVQGPAHRAMKPTGTDDSPLTTAYTLEWAKANGHHPVVD